MLMFATGKEEEEEEEEVEEVATKIISMTSRVLMYNH